MSVPTGWLDDGQTLTAPNGHKVINGFRQCVLAQNWHPDNWPLEEEHRINQLEVGNPSLGGGMQQMFRWTVLQWTESKGIFEMWTGQEIIALRTVCAKLYKQVAELKSNQNDPLAEECKQALIKLKPLLKKL